MIGGDLDLCLCSTGALTIDGGSLTVNGLSQGVTVEGGTLSVINGATLQVGNTPAANDLLVASNMIISGAGSSVTVNGFTGVGIFGPGTLSDHQRRRAQQPRRRRDRFRSCRSRRR